ncbi:MAG: bifunctional folylpolyglutamate synthase/dihydrofolate synthase [Verrucomicrobia bacterium]|nr:bifunctional folylpolyglutamate synthase/dihydrofolate synthase [Verrucomicrobiota bacterium]MBV9131039.1 bifunctional folylpolyglutamate synthase/dihydrofolate synthase [Verrucomicrobiota bacterium]
MNAAYSAAIDWLFKTQYRGIKLGLDNVRFLLAALGEPQNDLQFIHVAGTNGKGSVCAMIDSVCRTSGIKTGLFTSPHLVRFNERIQINGVPIKDAEVVGGLQRISALIDQDRHPTFFEITTALAFDYFRSQGVELVVLETGLGGRLDATNVVNPLVSVLTSIDMDHQKWLGHTLREIATEKAGIIKEGVPVVSGPQFSEVRQVLEQIASEHSAPFSYTEMPIDCLFVGLAGSHQRLNAAIAVDAIRKAAIQTDSRALKEGLANVYWPGRFQRVDARIILDGAHNPSAAKRVVETWRECVGPQRATIIFGGLSDKDLQGMIARLSALAARFLIVPIRSQRAASPADIASFLPQHVPAIQCASAEQGLKLAYRFDEQILVTGSLFLVGEILALLDSGESVLQTSSQ